MKAPILKKKSKINLRGDIKNLIIIKCNQKRAHSKDKFWTFIIDKADLFMYAIDRKGHR